MHFSEIPLSLPPDILPLTRFRHVNNVRYGTYFYFYLLQEENANLIDTPSPSTIL